MNGKMRSSVYGLLLSQFSSPLPMAQKEPVAYLYNGVRLPPLPEWDREMYPFACILPLSFYRYPLYIASGVTYYNSDDGDWEFRLDGDVMYYAYSDGDTEWRFRSDIEADSLLRNIGGIDYPLWVNTNLLSEDGTIGRIATDPVPVYE